MSDRNIIEQFESVNTINLNPYVERTITVHDRLKTREEIFGKMMSNVSPLTGEPLPTKIECLFCVGDVVMLRSGGPLMTVATTPDARGKLQCAIAGCEHDIWFNQYTLKLASRWRRFWNR